MLCVEKNFERLGWCLEQENEKKYRNTENQRFLTSYMYTRKDSALSIYDIQEEIAQW